MSPLDEETIEASLTRINAGFQSAGSPKVFEQYAQGVYLNKPFRRSEQALEVARALGGEQGYARVEQDKGPNCTFPENTEPAATGQGVVSVDFSAPTGERLSRARRGSPR